MNELRIFKNAMFEVAAKLNDGEVLFDAERVAKNLGFTETKNGIEYVRWRTVNSYLKFSQDVAKGDLIPEAAVYKLAFKASNETAEKFQDWLAIEVIPAIRKTGVYIPEELSPQLQFLINMELKQKQLEATIEETKQEVQAIRDTIVIDHKAEWRKECIRVLRAIGTQIDDYRKPNDEAYKALEERGHCRPSVLVTNLKSRALLNGLSKSKVETLGMLDVLENEPRLREIYIAIVKEMAIKNKVA